MKKVLGRMKILVYMTVFSLALFTLSSCSWKPKTNLDGKNPITISLWHYYIGDTQLAMDAAVEEFNRTVGMDKGIIVESFGYGAIQPLEDRLIAAATRSAGEVDFPNIFSTYADTAYKLLPYRSMANIADYFTKEELDGFIPSYLEEGYFEEGNLSVLPVVKSSDILYVNKTDWDKFKEVSSLEDSAFQTLDSIYEVSKQYFEWTDEATPDLVGDGSAFFGIDSIPNFILIASKQMNIDLLTVGSEGKPVANLDHEGLKKIFEFYYKGKTLGYFAATGRYRSDDVRTGDIVCYIGSTSKASYFPTSVFNKNKEYDIDFLAFPAPTFRRATAKINVQQGAGMAIGKATPAEEEGAAEFLKWFTSPDVNVPFSLSSGYIPVKTASLESDIFESSLKALQDGTKRDQIVSSVYSQAMTQVLNEDTFFMRQFQNSFEARRLLETSLVSIIETDEPLVMKKQLEGYTEEEIWEEIDWEQRYLDWINIMSEELKTLGIEVITLK